MFDVRIVFLFPFDLSTFYSVGVRKFRLLQHFVRRVHSFVHRQPALDDSREPDTSIHFLTRALVNHDFNT